MYQVYCRRRQSWSSNPLCRQNSTRMSLSFGPTYFLSKQSRPTLEHLRDVRMTDGILMNVYSILQKKNLYKLNPCNSKGRNLSLVHTLYCCCCRFLIDKQSQCSSVAKPVRFTQCTRCLSLFLLHLLSLVVVFFVVKNRIW